MTRLLFQGRLSDNRRFHWTVTRPKPVFFINREQELTPIGAVRKHVDLCNLRGELVDALYFRNTPELSRARIACEARKIPTYEADLGLIERYLMERFIKGSVCFEGDPLLERHKILYFVDPVVKPSGYTPDLKLLSIDIECSMQMDLYSIALAREDLEIVLMLDPARSRGDITEHYHGCPSEQKLLESFISHVQAYDPDVIIGWNVVGFDLQWLWRKCKKLGMDFNMGIDSLAEMVEPGKQYSQWIADIPGRAVLDGINMVKSAYVQTEDYSLSTVAKEVLGREKLIEKTGREKAEEITRLFHSDKSRLARYNLEDAKMVFDIFEKLNLSQLAVRRSQLTGLALDRVGGSVAAFDFLYLPLLHRSGYVGDTHPFNPDRPEAAPGGLVLDSIPGFYRNVALFDFKSLYPSIIRTFKVDPLAANIVLYKLPEYPKQGQNHEALRKVKGPAGLEFAEEFAVLPGLVEELWEEREKAKKAGDSALSQAIKIIMNSFYGVLGSPGCRFYDPRLAGTITRIGHLILTLSKEYFQQKDYAVIYGDTDSLFVHLGEGNHQDLEPIGHELSENLNQYLKSELNQRFHVESHLDIEFERLFSRFFMPTIRGDDKGSKKRYAGLVLSTDGEPILCFVGMESTRRDWTELAKEFQGDIFSLLFLKDEEPNLKELLLELIRKRHKQLYAGELDDKLVYRKGMSKPIKDYTKNVPPHVRAAKMLDHLDGRIVHYVMTETGPEPVQKRSNAKLDYDHYSEKQLAPVADMVLRFFDTDYRTLTEDKAQLNLF